MKRGESGLSLVVGIDKPVGITSHDVVNRCRAVFGEKRVGHTGTLDPMASGAMAVCVGPAAKLSKYLTSHDKAYAARIVFGTATDTDDREGNVVRTAPVPPSLSDGDVARAALSGLVGARSQLPPAYSAVKVGGVRSYEAARKGAAIDLRPRSIEVHAAQLISIGREDSGAPCWDVRLEVSAGTYIRSIARDLGISLGTCAHLGGLRRLRSGRLGVGECVTPDFLAANPASGRLDPVRLLGLRFCALGDAVQERSVLNGGRLDAAGLEVFEPLDAMEGPRPSFPCPPPVARSTRPLAQDETIAVLVGNKLVALYAYESGADCLRSRCVFAQGVSRGTI